MNLSKRIRLGGVFTFSILAVVMQQAEAATIVVNDDDIAPASFITTAIANANPGDIIEITGGADGVHNEGFPIAAIDKDLTIRGLGKDVTTVDGGGMGPVFQTDFGIKPSVRFENMTIQNGGDGGITSFGDLQINNCIIQNNTGNNSAVFVQGDLTVDDSSIINNAANGSSGGGIGAFKAATIRNSIIFANSSNSDGGGISAGDGVLRIESSSIGGNRAHRGGGIRAYNWTPEVSIFNSDIVGNQADTGGGISSSGGYLEITRTKISLNTANFGPGGGIATTGSTFIQTSELIENTTPDEGGGIAATADITVLNSTLSGNTATNAGGGIVTTSGLMTLQNTTIADNSSGFGGGVLALDRVQLINTLIANNTTGGDCIKFSPPQTIINNLITDAANACGLVDGQYGSIIGQDPLLGPLQDNGSSTKTYELLPGSPAIDAGSNDNCISADQRGKFRPIDGDGDGTATCDIGAFEAEAANQPPVITSSAARAVSEGRSLVGTVTATDADGDALSFSITGGANQDQFSIDSATGRLTIQPQDFEGGGDNPLLVEVTVSDGNGGSTVQLNSVTVTDRNEIPAITVSGPFTVQENSGLSSFSLQAVDPEGDSLIWSIGGGIFGDGPDAIYFSINPGTGVLDFGFNDSAFPNYEVPSDADGDNIYEVIIWVSDGNDNAVSTTVQVVVGDVNEAPVFFSDPAGATAENTTPVLGSLSVRDDDRDEISFSITGGADQSKFKLVDGRFLHFISAPDFENPADADADNVYLVEITADDGNGGTAAQLKEITVTDVSEALIISGSPATGVSFNTLYSFTPIAVDADGSEVSFEITGKPGWANFDPATGTLSGTPALDDAGIYNGIIIKAVSSDGDEATLAPFSIYVSGVNQPPVFQPGDSLTVCMNAGDQWIRRWASGIHDGDFGAQSLEFMVDNDKPELFGGLLNFGGQPHVDPRTGNLSFRPALNASGLATVTVALKDNGGTASSGVDTSATHHFTLTVDPSCDDGAGEIFNPGQFDFSYALDNIGNVPLGVLDNIGDLAPTAIPERLFSASVFNHGLPAANVAINIALAGYIEIVNVDPRCSGDKQSGEFQCQFGELPAGKTTLEFKVKARGNVTAVAEFTPINGTADAGKSGSSGGGSLGWLALAGAMGLRRLGRKKLKWN